MNLSQIFNKNQNQKDRWAKIHLWAFNKKIWTMGKHKIDWFIIQPT